MELNLDVEKINYMDLLMKKCVTQDEMTEVIVPDTLPDAAAIVCSRGAAFLRGKDANEIGMQVDGVVEGTVLYSPYGEEGIRKIDVTIPFTVCAETEGLNDESFLMADVSLRRLSVSILNPRKLSVHAEIRAEMRAYAKKNAAVMRCITAEKDIEILEKSVTVEVPAEISEKTFSVTDELTVPANKADVGEILFCSSIINEDETKGIGSKTVIRGRVTTDVVYVSTQDGGIQTIRFTSPFSQIVEFADNCEDGTAEAMISLTGAYITRGMPNSNGESVLELEVHAVAQCVMYKSTEVSYVEDVYSTKYELETQFDTVLLPRVNGRFSAVKTQTCSVETRSKPKEVISVAVCGNDTAVRNGLICSEMTVDVCYVDEEDSICLSHASVDAEMECDAAADGKAFADAKWEGETFCAVSGNSVEVRFPVKFAATSFSSEGIGMVSSVSYDESVLKDNSTKPSLMIYRTRGNDELWTLGKEYCSTEELILNANGLEGNAPLPEGMILVIPRKR